jgi:hypothetical protein
MHPWLRLSFVTLLSFLATWTLCEGLARIPWLRPLFGMGPSPKARTTPGQLTQSAEA